MTRDEALTWLHKVKWALADGHRTGDAWLVEDVESKLLQGLSTDELRAYADMILPPGRSGRTRLALNGGFTARVYAWLRGVLLAVDG